jgi:hypothetical protein
MSSDQRSPATLVVVSAARPGSPAPAHSRLEQRAPAGLDTLWTQEDALIDTDVKLLVANAPPAEALCRVAKESAAEGIVVGRHHVGPFNADTGRHLLYVADLPVTVVPS